MFKHKAAVAPPSFPSARMAGETFDSNPDQWGLAASMINRSMDKGHDPVTFNNGGDVGLMCRNCGRTAQMHYNGKEWEGIHAPHASLIKSQCH